MANQDPQRTVALEMKKDKNKPTYVFFFFFYGGSAHSVPASQLRVVSCLSCLLECLSTRVIANLSDSAYTAATSIVR